MYIQNIIEENRKTLFTKIESTILEEMRQLLDRYSSIARHLTLPVTTAKEVEDMERYKYDLNMDKVSLNTRASICFERVVFLTKMSFSGSEILMQSTSELHEWPK